jgi:hypothetical protein
LTESNGNFKNHYLSKNAEEKFSTEHLPTSLPTNTNPKLLATATRLVLFNGRFAGVSEIRILLSCLKRKSCKEGNN